MGISSDDIDSNRMDTGMSDDTIDEELIPTDMESDEGTSSTDTNGFVNICMNLFCFN